MNTLHLPAIALGALLSFAAHADTSTETNHDEHAPVEQAPTHDSSGDKHQQVKDHSTQKDDNAVDTLDGDATPEGQRGDSTDPESPGGEQGDGRNDPGLLQ